ncbi:MAG: ATP-grasp domain-containing protein [Deltaproteobacteria bacterium]|nr:ATP-grasp domain-containing protein [Deltaproteobacteria bacterium]
MDFEAAASRDERPPSEGPVLVVGTTPDYVARLYEAYPGFLVFLTDLRFRADPLLRGIPTSAQLFAPLVDMDRTANDVARHFSGEARPPQGVACFDCESLLAASRVASGLGLRFPSARAIAGARNKFEARTLWAARGLKSPRAALASDLNGSLRHYEACGGNVVLKPLSGSGSELLFHCTTEEDLSRAVGVLEQQLPKRRSNPLFAPLPGGTPDPCSLWLVEEYVAGAEFSCDFVLQEGQVFLIRETGKIKDSRLSFGSVLGYTLPPGYPEGFDKGELLRVLKAAAEALGFDRGYFMADYIVQNDHPVLIEMSPRPGGDSIPDLVAFGAGIDLFDIYFDFVTGRCHPPQGVDPAPRSCASLNFYASHGGRIREIDASRLGACPGVKAVVLKKAKGDRVLLPPGDYDNRLLGYCIAGLGPGEDPFLKQREMEELLGVVIEGEEGGR